MRTCERLVGVNRRTVLNVLAVAGQKCNELLNAKLKNLHVTEVQIDELYSFVRSLPQNTDAENSHEGEQWVYLAVERNTKMILNWYVERRTGATSQEFLRVLKSRLADERFQLTTDCFAPYCSSSSTVFSVFRERIDYGVSGGMKVVESWRFEIPFSSRAFSSGN